MTVTAEHDQADVEIERPWWALTAVLIGVALIVLEGSLVNVLIPTIVDDLTIDRSQVLWVTSIYSMVFAAFLITFGTLSDRVGRRRLFLIGIAVFLGGSLLAGAATSGTWLILARAVEAFGGAMMLPTSIALINVHFRGDKRAAAFGLWGAVFGGMAAFGPLLGGWMAQEFSWRWAFYINIPVGLVSVALVLRFVPRSRVNPRAAGVEPFGVLLSSLGLALVVYGLIEGQAYGWWRALNDIALGPLTVSAGSMSPVPIAIVTGLVVLAGFVAWEAHRARTGRSVMMDLSLFRIRRYSYGNVVATTVSLGEFGALFMLPLWLQAVKGYDPIATGALIAVLGVGTVLAGGSAREAARALGPTRLIRVGMVLEILGLIGLAFTLSTTWSAWWLAIPMMVYGIGVGFDTAQLTNVVMQDVPPAKSGNASSMTSTFRQVGSTLGSAMLGALLFSALATSLNTSLKSDASMSAAQRESIVDEVVNTSGQYILALEKNPSVGPAADEAKQAYTDAARIMTLAASGFILVGLLFSLGLPADERRRPAKTAHEGRVGSPHTPRAPYL